MAINTQNAILDQDHDDDLGNDEFMIRFNAQFNQFNQNTIEDIKDISIYQNPKDKIKKNKDQFKANF